jgi:hypothetical protein
VAQLRANFSNTLAIITSVVGTGWHQTWAPN